MHVSRVRVDGVLNSPAQAYPLAPDLQNWQSADAPGRIAPGGLPLDAARRLHSPGGAGNCATSQAVAVTVARAVRFGPGSILWGV